MTREEKLQLIRDRQKAVRDAWSREKTLVCQGKGTVNWNSEQQRELMEKGRVSGYEGQHMKSVSQYPEYASSADNIQFLTHEDHLAAHNMGNVNEQNGYHSVTNGTMIRKHMRCTHLGTTHLMLRKRTSCQIHAIREQKTATASRMGMSRIVNIPS